MKRGEVRQAMLPAVAAGGGAAVLAILYAVTGGWWPFSPAYFVLCLALNLVFSVAVGLLCGLWERTVPQTLPLWVALDALLGLDGWAWRLRGVGDGLFSVLLPVAATFLALRLYRRRGRCSEWLLGQGFSVSGALFWGEVLYPQLARSVGIHRASPVVSGQLAPALAYFLVLVVLLRLASGPGGGAPRKWAPGAVFALAALVPLLHYRATARDLPDHRGVAFETAERRAAGPTILLFVLDTVRADHLSLYGYHRPTTPALEAFLARHPEAAVYPRAFANGNWTVPSHASLLTGLLPSEHGAHFASGARSSIKIRFRLGPEVSTLAERLRRAGYRTFGISANPWLIWTRGLSRGFEIFFRPASTRGLPIAGERLRRHLMPGIFPEALTTYPEAGRISRQLLRHLEACQPGPCFAFANYLESHALYTPTGPCRGRFVPWSLREPIVQPLIDSPPELLARLEARYDEELCSLDLALARLLTALEDRGILEQSWTFITSDHGEAFGEHGVTEHSTAVYNEEVRVPLIVIPPAGQALEGREGPVSLVDVAATIAAIGGVAQTGAGVDLRSPRRGLALARIEFFGDVNKAEFAGLLAAEPARAVVMGRHKLIEHIGRLELYDLAKDIAERRDLAAEQADLVSALRPFLPPLGDPLERDEGHEEEPFTAEQRRALHALGYIQ